MTDTLHLVCAQCQAVNRVPRGRLGSGRCGKCKAPLHDDHPIELDAAAFRRQVEKSDLPVVVDFWAPWCGPCKSLTPILEKVAKEYEGKVKLVKVDSDQNQELSATFGIKSIPNVIAFKNGRPVAQFMGAQPEGQVRAFFEKLLPTPSEAALMRAAEAWSEGRLDEAEAALKAVEVETDPQLEAKVETLRQGIAFARADKGAQSGDESEAGLRAKVAANPADLPARSALAALHAGARRYRQAMDELLEIIRRDKTWNENEARKQMLAIFNLAGDDPVLVSEYRRKLSALLY